MCTQWYLGTLKWLSGETQSWIIDLILHHTSHTHFRDLVSENINSGKSCWWSKGEDPCSKIQNMEEYQKKA
jgi:hypothetical protein